MQASERPAPRSSTELLVGLAFALLAWLVKFLIMDVWHFTGTQAAEFSSYFVLFFSGLIWLGFWIRTAHSRREKDWPHPYMAVPAAKMNRQPAKRGVRAPRFSDTTFMASHGSGPTGRA